MQQESRYAVGIDVGTTVIRCVVGFIDETAGGTPTVVGVGQAPNSGMRKGVVVKLNGPASAIDVALGEAERMSGHQVNEAIMSINGSHITSSRAEGMVAVSGPNREVTADDINRVQEVATTGKIPENREIVEVAAHAYTLDGQDNIKDPLGMLGTRLEVVANIVSVMRPHLENLERAAETAQVKPVVAPAIMAAARAVLSEHQMESGVAVVDIGGATTGVAVFEEGDLLYVGVIPIGGSHITNDLAIGLKTDPEVAEAVKLAHGHAGARRESASLSVEARGEKLTFDSADIDEIIDARLDEIFDGVQNELKKAGRAGKLPSGIVLTGGTANLKGIAPLAREKLGLAARIGKPTGFGGVADNIETPEYAAAVGLMLLDAQQLSSGTTKGAKQKAGQGAKRAGSIFSRIFGSFRT